MAVAASGALAAILARVATGSFYAIVGWVLSVIGIRLLLRERVDGLYAGVFAGLSIAVFGGLLDLATLSRSFTPSALPVGLARMCVALTAGAGLGLAAACLLVIQRTPDARRVVSGADSDTDDDASTGPISGGIAEPAGSGGIAEPAGSGGTAEPAGSGGNTEPAGSGGNTEPAGAGGRKDSG